MQDPKRLAIHVVAWNHREALDRLFASLEAQTFRGFQTVVVDQASTDGLATWLQTTHPETIMLRNFHNHGCARAYNQATALTLLRWSEEEMSQRYLVFMRPDVAFAPDALEKMVDALDHDANLMFVGPCVYVAQVKVAEDGETRIAIPTEEIESYGTRLTKTRSFIDIHELPTNGEVFAPASSCFVVRASALRVLAIDGQWFDEQLLPGQELWDLFWRARLAGFAAKTRMDAVVSRSSGMIQSSWETLCATRVKTPMCLKNDRWLLRISHAPWILFDHLAVSFSLFRHPFLLLAWFKSFRGYRLMYHRRKAVMAFAKVSQKEMRKMIE